MPVSSRFLTDFDLTYVRCSGSITIDEIYELIDWITSSPAHQSNLVLVDSRGCSGVHVDFSDVFSLASKLKWELLKRLRNLSAIPKVHFFVPDDGIIGAVRQFQAITEAFGGMEVHVHRDLASLQTSLGTASLTYQSLLEAEKEA